MSKTIVRLDNVGFTKNPARIKSAMYQPSGAIENGMFVEIGGLLEGEREIHEVTVPTAKTVSFGIVCTPELEYDENGYHGLETFENPADTPIRVGILGEGDIISMTAGAFDVAPTVGQFVELQAGIKGKVVDTPTSGSTQVGEVIAVESNGRFTYYVIEVK